MPRQPVTIGAHTFPSKRAAEDYFTAIRDRVGDWEPLSGQDAADAEALLDNHEHAAEKIGQGILFYYVAQEEERGCRCFHVLRKDDTTAHFSYKKAVDGYTNKRARFMAAARAVVAEDVAQAKTAHFERHADANGLVRVPGSDRPHARNETHIDHDPPFRKIVDDFMASAGITPETTAYVVADVAGTRFADQNLADRFRAYHSEHARYSVIAKIDNLRRAWAARADRQVPIP